MFSVTIITQTCGATNVKHWAWAGHLKNGGRDFFFNELSSFVASCQRQYGVANEETVLNEYLLFVEVLLKQFPPPLPGLLTPLN